MKTESPKGSILARTGAYLQIGPIIHFLVGVLFLSAPGADSVSLILKLGILSLAMSLSGGIMLYTALLIFKYRAAWFYRFMALFSTYLVIRMSLFTLPIGILTAIYLLSRKDHFYKNHS